MSVSIDSNEAEVTHEYADEKVIYVDKKVSLKRISKAFQPKEFNENIPKKSGIKKSEISDLTKDKVDVRKSIGLMAYSIPEQMTVGKRYTIKLRISKDDNKVTLIDGDRNIPINDVNIDSKITIESIRVESVMSAQLISEKDRFDIVPASTEFQNIDSIGYTEWEWRIIPLKGGHNFLKLIVKVKTNDFYKDITVFDKNISVKSNTIFSVSVFIKEYWQWMMSTIVIPYLIWWWNRKRKQKRKTKVIN